MSEEKRLHEEQTEAKATGSHELDDSEVAKIVGGGDDPPPADPDGNTYLPNWNKKGS